MNKAALISSITFTCLLSCSHCYAIKHELPYQAPTKPPQHLVLVFDNQSASRIRVEMQRSNTGEKNPSIKGMQRERRWLEAFGKARFVTCRIEEVAVLTIFRNGKVLKKAEFGPFNDSAERTVLWNGSSMVLKETRHN